MLGDSTVIASIAVSNLDKSKEFYGSLLGLKQIKEIPSVVTYESGDGKLMIYESDIAGKNQATCAMWDVEDVQKMAGDLKSAGINFEHYDFPGGSVEGDVHIMGDTKAAWFKDPDGNILSIASSS